VKTDKDLSDPGPPTLHCHARPRIESGAGSCAGHPDPKNASDRDGRDKPGHDTAQKWHRPILFALAWIFLAIGIVGLFLPLLPGTLFLIFAAACFTRSSPRFEAWLLDHPRLGPPVRKWRATGAIPRTAKIFACASLVASWLILFATSTPLLVLVLCFALFAAVAAYVVSRPNM
jgi:uncharacterized membrane protein YbaN (DUF454 family)